MPHGSSFRNFSKFWKPFLTNQITNFDNKIMLAVYEEVVTKNQKRAYFFKAYFNDITRQCSNLLCQDPLVYAII